MTIVMVTIYIMELTPEQLEKLRIAEEAHYADMDMAEISSELSKPTSINTTLAETPIHSIASDQYKFTGTAQYRRDYEAYKQELERILAKRFEQMTKEEDLIVNSSDHITVTLRAEIQADKLKKPSSLPSRQEQKLQTFEIAKKTAIADGKRKTNLLPIGTVVDTPKAGVPVGDTVKDKLASIQALKNAAISQSTEPISRRYWYD